MRKMIILILMAVFLPFGVAAHAALIDNGNDTVTDTRTGLIWEQFEPGAMTWGAALSYCEGRDLGGSTSWRLPNYKELESLTDDTRLSPAIDISKFPNAHASYYWSSTSWANSPANAWVVYFGNVHVTFSVKSGAFHVRCVRGGQSGPFGNLAPTDINSSSLSIVEHQAPGAPVGTLSTADPNSGDTFTYTLATGAGGTDNALFSIAGNLLQTAAMFNYETQTTHSIRLRSTDQGGLSFEKSFEITVSHVNGPTDIALSNTSVMEHQVHGAPVGTLSTTDPNSGDTFTYTLATGAGGTDNALFSIAGSELKTAAMLDYETKSTHNIRLRSTDQSGYFVEKPFLISVLSVNAPTDIALSNTSVLEHQVPGAAVGSLSTTDPNSGDTFTYTLATGAGSADNALFSIAGSDLKTAAMLDYETKSTHNIRLRSTDQSGNFVEKPFTITVSHVNGPTSIALSNTSVMEHQIHGAPVGTLSTTDPNSGDTFTYTLATGAGGTDNALFSIVGSDLKTAAMLDYETKSTHNIRLRSTDSSGYFIEKPFLISVTSVNAPTDIALSNSTVIEHQAPGAPVGTLSSTDPNSGETFTYTLATGAGGTDNALFSIAGDLLKTAAILDFETKTTHGIRVRTTDHEGLFYEKPFTITVIHVNRAPVLGAVGNKTVDEGQQLAFTLTATDEDGNALTFTSTPLPTGATLNPTTGAFSWTPGYDQAGSYPITFTVTDNGTPNLNDTESITVTVNNVNRAPVLDVVGNKKVDEGKLLAFSLAATDADGNGLTYTSTVLPTGATLNPTSGAFSWTPGFDQSGSYPITFTVTDNGPPNLNDTETITVRVANVITLPAPWVGSVTITSDKNVVAVGRPHIDGEVASYGGFPAGSTSAYLPMLFKDAFGGSYDAAFYVQNVQAVNTATIVVKYYNSAGKLNCTVNDTVPPLSSKGYWVPGQSCLPAGWVGGVVVTSDQPIVAIGRPHIGAEVMSYDSFPEGSLTSSIPMLFKGAFGGSYNSAFYVQNVHTTLPANLTINYYDSVGTLSCSKTDSVARRASKGYWVPSESCLPDGWVGGVVVTSDQPIVTVGRPHIGTQVTTYNGFAAGAGTSYVPMLFKGAFGGTYDSAFYIQNVDDGMPANLAISYYNSAGTLSCTVNDTVAPLASKGYWVPAQTCLPAGWVGGIVIASDQPVVAVGRPHIGAQVTTYNGFTAGSTNSYLPMLFNGAFGGTYNSAFYIQNTVAGEAAVSMEFYDNLGTLTCTRTDTIPALANLGLWLPGLTCSE